MSALPFALCLCRAVGAGTTLRRATIHRDRRDRRRSPLFLCDSAQAEPLFHFHREAEIVAIPGPWTEITVLCSPPVVPTPLALSWPGPVPAIPLRTSRAGSTHASSEKRRIAGPSGRPSFDGACPAMTRPLLQLHFGADLLQGGLDLVGLFLVHAFLDRLGRALDQILGLLEAETGQCTYFLD